MECRYIEERLSEYIERSLPQGDMLAVAKHLNECRACAGLLEQMRSALATCRAFPVVEPDLELIERVLLRTTGRPRTRTLKEVVRHYIFGPMLTPRFAVGTGLAVLFVALVINFMAPRIGGIASSLTPRELLKSFDRGAQSVYAQGLKAYDKKNEWQAQITFFKNNVFNRLGFMIERLDVPQEGKKKSGKPGQQQDKAPNEKSSLLLLPA
jgi:hypothetical protein